MQETLNLSMCTESSSNTTKIVICHVAHVACDLSPISKATIKINFKAQQTDMDTYRLKRT